MKRMFQFEYTRRIRICNECPCHSFDWDCCSINNKIVSESGKRPFNCPLVEVKDPEPCCICEGKVLGEIHYQTHECGDDWNRIAPFCPNCGRPLRKDVE